MEITKKELWLRIIIPFGLGFFITSIFRSVNAVLAYPIIKSLHLNVVEIGWVSSMYMLTFAFTQIPLGIALDHWGPRKTQSFFFCIGAVGIILFGLSSSVSLLALGRAILGVGMAGGLTAAIKAVTEWVNQEKIPFYNGVILAIGCIGAIVATTPSKLFMIDFGWRSLCITLGIITFLIALLILWVSLDKPSSKAEQGIWKRMVSLKTIYSDPFFWQIMPLFMTSLGGFVTMQGLWLGPWLQNVVGFSSYDSANYLLIVAFAMTVGTLSGGFFSHLSKIMKVPLATVIAIGIIIHIVTQVLLIFNYFSEYFLTWFIYGYFSTIALIAYALIAQHFGHELSGRGITAANIFVFLFAFITQYLFGFVVHLWPHPYKMVYVKEGYQAAFLGLVILELLSLIWFFIQGQRINSKKNIM